MDRSQPPLPTPWQRGVMSSVGRKGEVGAFCLMSDFPAVLLMGNQLSKSSRSRSITATTLPPLRALPGCCHGRRAGPPGGGTGAGRGGPEGGRPKVGAALPSPALRGSPRLPQMEYDWLGFGYAALVAAGGVVGYAKAGGWRWPWLSLSRPCPQAAPAPPRCGAEAAGRSAAGSRPAAGMTPQVPLSPCCHRNGARGGLQSSLKNPQAPST